MNIYAERLERLRNLMRGKGWDAVIVTGSDPHGSEYPARRWKQVEWLSGFTGEAGDIVVTLDHAGLWTDTRYFIQARQQLADTGIELHKTRIPEQVLIPEWLRSRFDADALIAVDGLCQNASDIRELSGDFQIVSVPDMLDSLWTDRPSVPQTPIRRIGAGESTQSKLEWLRTEISLKGCGCMLVTALDEIAWLLNIRANDIDYNPYSISYLLVTDTGAEWFVTRGEIEEASTRLCLEGLRNEGVDFLPYDEVFLHLDDGTGAVLLDRTSVNYHLFSLMDRDVRLDASPVRLRKAVKNSFEIEGMRKAHLEDGVAMEKFLYWLEKSVDSGKKVTEWDAAVRLGQFRAESDGYTGDSFETISAYGAGAALPHYITPVENAPVIGTTGLYLCDSGGQYLYGTTDITRTVPMGECSGLEKEDYTLVLKGHIDLAMASFPAGTAGCQIDALARNPLWLSHRNFGHGTGHGVGFFLGVHEGPQDIRQNFNSQPLLPGMITSDEPGIYREGRHGVRHENLVLCREAGENGFGKWYDFETLTLCHFDTSAILTELLSKEEKRWLNAYNERVFKVLSPLLPENVADWLKAKTAAI